MDFVAHDIGVAATRFQRVMTQAVSAALENTSLTASEYGVLDHIRRHPGVSNADLARYLFVTPQALGRITNRLLARGLVSIDTSAPGRRQPVVPTEAGEELYLEVRPRIDAALDALMSVLDGLERHRLRASLTAIADAADRAGIGGGISGDDRD